MDERCLPALSLECLMAGNGQDPGFGASGGLIARRAFPNADKGILKNVLRKGTIPAALHQYVLINRLTHAFINRTQCLTVTRRRTCKQQGKIRGAHGVHPFLWFRGSGYPFRTIIL